MTSLPAKRADNNESVLNSTALNTAVTAYYGHQGLAQQRITNAKLSELNKVNAKIAEATNKIASINLEALDQVKRQTVLLELQIANIKLEKLENERQKQLKQCAFTINAELKTAVNEAPIVRFILSCRRRKEAMVVGFKSEALNEITDKEYALSVESNLNEAFWKSLEILSPIEIDLATQYLDYLDNKNNDEVTIEHMPIDQRERDLASKGVTLTGDLDVKKAALKAEMNKADPKKKSVFAKIRNMISTFTTVIALLILVGGCAVSVKNKDWTELAGAGLGCVIFLIGAGIISDKTEYRDEKVLSPIQGEISKLEKELADYEGALASMKDKIARERLEDMKLKQEQHRKIEEINRKYPQLVTCITMSEPIGT